MERGARFNANSPGKHTGNTGTATASPPPRSGALHKMWAENQAHNPVHSTGSRYYACYSKANDSTTTIFIFGPPQRRPAIMDIASETHIFLLCFSVGHSWTISLCLIASVSQTCQFSVFHAHKNGLGQQDQHLMWNTGTRHSCHCNSLIYSGNKNILYLQMLAKVWHWHYTHSYLNIMHKKGCFTIIEIGIRKPEYTREYFKWGSYPKPP